MRFPQQRLKRLAEVKSSNVDKKSIESEPAVRLCNYTDVYYRQEISGDQDFMAATASPAQIREFSLRAGDVILTKDSETPDDIGVSTFVRENLPDVVCGYHLALVRPAASINSRFLFWALNAKSTLHHLSAGATGVTRFGLRLDVLQNIPVGVPSLGTQDRIARFLDRETARIDALAEKRRKLVELLYEKRTAQVTHATTRGLDHAPSTRPSRTDWLSTCPSHWQTVPLRAVAARRQEPNTPVKVEQVLSVVAGRGVIRYEEKGNVGNKASEDISRYQIVRPGDIVVNSMNVIIGSSGMSSHTGCLSPVYYVLNPNRTMVEPQFLELLFQTPAFYEQLVRLGNGILAHRLRIPWERLKTQRICLPEVKEQRRIIAEVSSKLSKIDQLVSAANSQLQYLAERREALITAAVTGQLDIANHNVDEDLEAVGG